MNIFRLDLFRRQITQHKKCDKINGLSDRKRRFGLRRREGLQRRQLHEGLHTINTFDGTLNVAGGFVGRLTINLTGAFDEWTMAGEMNLAGSNLAAFPLERVAGSPLRVTGDVNVEHRVRIAADTNFANGSTITFASAAAQLQMTGETLVTAGAAFAGGGALANGPSGENDARQWRFTRQCVAR
jgi:hypothetical protein